MGSLGNFGCVSTKKEPPKSQPVVPLFVTSQGQELSDEFMQALRKYGKSSGIHPEEQLVVLTSCHPRGYRVLQKDIMVHLVKELREITRGNILIGCWVSGDKSTALQREQNLHELAKWTLTPLWQPHRCETVKEKDSRGKEWTLPLIVQEDDWSCHLKRVGGLIVVSSIENEFDHSLALSAASGLIAPQQHKNIQELQDLLHILELLPPIKLTIFDGRPKGKSGYLALANSPIPIELLFHAIKKRIPWEQKSAQLITRWMGHDPSLPLIQFEYSQNMKRESMIELSEIQKSIEVQ